MVVEPPSHHGFKEGEGAAEESIYGTPCKMEEMLMIFHTKLLRNPFPTGICRLGEGFLTLARSPPSTSPTCPLRSLYLTHTLAFASFFHLIL